MKGYYPKYIIRGIKTYLQACFSGYSTGETLLNDFSVSFRCCIHKTSERRFIELDVFGQTRKFIEEKISILDYKPSIRLRRYDNDDFGTIYYIIDMVHIAFWDLPFVVGEVEKINEFEDWVKIQAIPESGED